MRILSVALAILITSSVGLPCTTSCLSLSVCEMVTQAEAIVVAETVSLGEPVGEDSVLAKMKVLRRYKSSPHVGETFEKVVSRESEMDGRQWLVFFVRNEETDEIRPAGDCTDQPLDRASAELSFLDAWAEGSLDSLTQLKVVAGYDGLSVVAEGANLRYESISDAGVASFNGIPAGMYTVGASGRGFKPMSREDYEEVNLLEHACGSTPLWLETTNRVSGVVVDPEGSPVSGATVVMIQSDDRGQPMSSIGPFVATDSDGRFIFEEEDPGRYWLGVNVRHVSGRTPYPATFYPGVEDFSDAELIELGAGDRVSDLTIHVARRLQERSIRVKVLWSDGTPAAGARISRSPNWEFDDPIEYFGYSQNFEALPANEEGWIRLTAYGSSKYRLKAVYTGLRVMAGVEKGGESLPIEITPGIGPLDLEVRLRRYEPGICGSKNFLE